MHQLWSGQHTTHLNIPDYSLSWNIYGCMDGQRGLTCAALYSPACTQQTTGGTTRHTAAWARGGDTAVKVSITRHSKIWRCLLRHTLVYSLLWTIKYAAVFGGHNFQPKIYTAVSCTPGYWTMNIQVKNKKGFYSHSHRQAEVGVCKLMRWWFCKMEGRWDGWGWRVIIDIDVGLHRARQARIRPRKARTHTHAPPSVGEKNITGKRWTEFYNPWWFIWLEVG